MHRSGLNSCGASCEVAEQLKGKYIVERPVGRGGMGEVHAGRTIGVESFSYPVAIKRIHSQYSDDPYFRSLFVAEARLMARLSHVNIVTVHDFDQDEAGRLFLVMELVDGTDLAGLLRTGALPLPVVLFVTCEILRGLGHAHDIPPSGDAVRGIVHRDVSPQNVLIGWDGAVKISDFGLAKARAAAMASASLQVKGKIAYMSPEQVNNEPLDGRSDLFSVGVMLWEMICDSCLFGRDSLRATVKSLQVDTIPPPRSRSPGLPEHVERVTMRLLERDRDRRYHAASAAIEALSACEAYPKNGRELLSALLRERLPERDRAQHRSGEGVGFSEQKTASAPPVARLLAPAEPYPDPPRRSRARRVVPLVLLGVATALTASLSVGSTRIDAGALVPQSAPAARPAEPLVNDQQPSETRASTETSAAPQLSAPPAHGAPAPTTPAPTTPAPTTPATTTPAEQQPRTATVPTGQVRTGIRRVPTTERQARPASDRKQPASIRVIELDSSWK